MDEGEEGAGRVDNCFGLWIVLDLREGEGEEGKSKNIPIFCGGPILGAASTAAFSMRRAVVCVSVWR